MSGPGNGPVWADVAPPPTFVIDSLWLGLPLGPVVGLALAAAAVTGFLWLRRRAHWAVAGLVCVLLYAAANFGCYLYGLEQLGKERERQQRRRPAAPTAPATAHPTTAPSPPVSNRPPN
jgi:hypothetical protein